MGAQRKGRHGDGVRRLDGRKAQLLRHEARRAQRRRRSPLHHRLYGRECGHGHLRCGRRGHAFLAERAGFPPLCGSRQAPHAGTLGQQRSPRLCQGRLRNFRTVRYARHHQDVHARRALAERRRNGRARRAAHKAIRKEYPKERHDARQCEEAALRRRKAHEGAKRVCGDHPPQPHRMGRQGARHHHLLHVLSVHEGSLRRQRQRLKARHGASPARKAHQGVRFPSEVARRHRRARSRHRKLLQAARAHGHRQRYPPLGGRIFAEPHRRRLRPPRS